MFEFINSLYSSFEVSAISLMVICSLVAGTITQLVRDGERSWRERYKTAKPALMDIYLRATATVIGMVSGVGVYYSFMEIPAPVDPETVTILPYAGPSLILSIFLGFLGGLFFTLVIAGLKGHLSKNSATKVIADSLPSFTEETIKIPVQIESAIIEPPENSLDEEMTPSDDDSKL